MSDSPNSSTHSVSHCFKDKTMRKWWLLQSSEPGTTATKTFRIILTQPPRVPSGLPPAVLDLQAAVERRPLPHTHTRGAVWVLCESRYWGLAWSCTTGCYWWGGKHLQVCAPHRPWDQQTCGSPGLAWPRLPASEKALSRPVGLQAWPGLAWPGGLREGTQLKQQIWSTLQSSKRP